MNVHVTSDLDVTAADAVDAGSLLALQELATGTMLLESQSFVALPAGVAAAVLRDATGAALAVTLGTIPAGTRLQGRLSVVYGAL